MAASPPPPAPKIDPMNAVTAMTSFTVNGGGRVAGRRPVGVDAVGVGLGVVEDLLALRAVRVDQELSLLRHQRLGLRARGEGLDARDQREGVDVGHVGDGDARRTASDRDQEPAVARRRPAGAERDVAARLPVDVRDAPGVVDELQTGPAGHLLMGGADRLEVLGKVELIDVREGDVVAQRREAAVQRELIRRVRGER